MRLVLHSAAHWAAGLAVWYGVCLAALAGTDEPWVARFVPAISAVLGAFPVALVAPAFRNEPLWRVLLSAHAAMLAGGMAGALIDQSPMTCLITGIYGYWLGIAAADRLCARAAAAVRA